MCGIAGFIDVKVGLIQAQEQIEIMLESMRHRGPDYRGTYFNQGLALGHNRLAIVDLSEEGNQPMLKYGLSIVFNGEIYNYIELRQELLLAGYSFSSQSDTEVILVSYKHWGVKCVEKFNGMWAFAIWDEETRELFCSRDRFGIKPFYYISVGDRFYFASEYKALKNTPLFRNDLNLNQVSRSLQLGWCTYKDETYYNCISQLEAGNNLFVKEGKVQISEYWAIGSGRYKYIDHETSVKDFKGLLEDAVKIHMRSDVEVAVCLSGGIDSSSLTGIIGKLYPDLKFHTFSIYYDGPGEVDERPFIDEVVGSNKNIIPHYYKPDKSVIPDFFSEVVDKSDVPITGSSPISHFYLVKKIHESGIKVVLDGQGADEYLAGYNPAYYRWIADELRRLNLIKSIQNLNSAGIQKELKFSDLIKYFGKSFLSSIKNEVELVNMEYEKYYPFLVNKEFLKNKAVNLTNYGSNRLDNYLYQAMTQTSLPTILHYVDRMTMSHSVESRVPLLDHRLVDFAFSLPSKEKLHKGVTKKILREAAIDVLPTKIYNRKDKKGFVTPGEDVWLRGKLSWLLDVDYKNLNYIDKIKATKLIENYKNGDNSSSRIVWRLCLLNYWQKNQ